MASCRGFVMAKFYEASAYRNTPRLSTPSLDEVAWAIFCGYFVPLQAALSSFIFTIIVHLVECILVHNHGGWLSSSLSLWFCHNTLQPWVRVCRKHLKARDTCLKIVGMELHSEHLHSRLPAQKRNWIGPSRSGLPIAFFGLLSGRHFRQSPAKLPPR